MVLNLFVSKDLSCIPVIYNFPVIKTIDDVLPHIKGREEFLVSDKGDYIVINYTHRTADTFPPIGGPNDYANAVLRECRGIAFYPNGIIMSRPFHKFFNLGENSEVSKENVTRELNYTTPILLEKLDGSMIRPMFIGEHIRLGTKMGITDTSDLAEVWMADKTNYYDLIASCCENNATPIFEWCSRKSKIVLDYPKDRLVLTAVRFLQNGSYLSHPDLVEFAKIWEVDYVYSPQADLRDIGAFSDWVSRQDNIEGFVIKMDTNEAAGHMFKDKCDWYLGLHKTKSALSEEKNVLELILNETVDDLLPLLDANDKAKVLAFQHQVHKEIKSLAEPLDKIIQNYKNKGMTAKEFAINHVPAAAKTGMPSGILFDVFHGKRTAREAIVDFCLKNCNNRKGVENVRKLLGDHVRYEEINKE